MKESKLKLGSFEEWECRRLQVVRAEELKPVMRRCLRCDKSFKAFGRYNRICRDCHVSPIYCGASQILDFCS
jgi:hypothetical protein